MASAGKTFRLSTSGADQTSREFGKVGEAGRKMGADIAKGAKGISPAMRGIDTAVGQAKDGIKGFAGQAGALGGVLQSMGPLGLAAAAGIGAIGAAFTVAVQRGTQAIEWAESLDLLAQRLDTSARSIQEWRFAASQFGVDTEKADAALDSLNKNLGLAALGFARQAALFEKLGFTPAQIKGFQDVDAVLPQIADKLAALAPQERQALADKLGIADLLPVLRDGRAGVADLKKQFEDLNLVIGDRALAKAAKDNDRLDVSTARLEATVQRLNLQLTGSASGWGDFKIAGLEAVEDILSAFQEIEDRSPRVLKQMVAQQKEALGNIGTFWWENPDTAQNILSGGAYEARLKQLIARGEAALKASAPKPDDFQMAAAGFPMLLLARQARTAAAAKPDPKDLTDPPKVDPAVAAAENYVKTLREAQRVREGLNAIEAQSPGITQDEVKSKWELVEAYRRLEEARKLGVKLTDADVQTLLDSIKADQAKAASLKERDAAQRIADERQGRADSARQSFEAPLMRYKREAAELRDLQRGGELTRGEAEEALRALAQEYDDVAASMFESSKAGQLLDGVLRGQIKSVGDLGRAFLELAKGDAIKALYASLSGLFGLTDGGGKSKGGGLFKSLLSAGVSLLSGGKSGGANSHTFGGGRATGGPVMPGMFYRVNENTPRSEWFAPSVPGTIVTAAQADQMMARQNSGGGGSFAPVFAPTIDARGADGAAVSRLEAVMQQQQAEFQSWAAGERQRVWGHMGEGYRRSDALRG